MWACGCRLSSARPHACWWTRLWRTQRDRIAYPNPTFSTATEWVDPTESEEEDPEELVPEPSEDEPGEEPQEEPLEVQPPVPPSAPPQEQPQEEPEDPAVDPEDLEQDPDAGDAPPSDDDEDDDEAGPVVTTTHRWFDYPLPVPRMLRETLEMLHYDQFWITYVGTRYRHPVLPDDWDMTVEISIPDEFGSRRNIHVRHAPTRRNSHEAAISDAAREALTTLCHAHREDMAITSRRYYPCRSVERLDAWIANPEAEQNPRLESTIEYLATLNTDYNAALDELDMVRYENRKLRAWVAHGVEPAEEEPVEDPADAPRRKKARYDDPEARTYIRHHED
ncbi:hypothetical protein U9M48_002466 [Paspalum notatum var. saurae]|uniref:Uncharacterized protein n=1 Tax=Paspalum notatum var. saurae TaxID=547442 RepID=A0AAQ3PHS1_PASNO